jgi:hypothetical protein
MSDASTNRDDTEAAQPDNPPPASESLPDGQFQDQEMPTTDGESAARDDRGERAAPPGEDNIPEAPAYD